MTEPVFCLKNVSYHVTKQIILSDLSFNVDKGEFLAILGPSGAGKSTLLRLFNCLESPTAGALFFHGKPLSEMDMFSLRKKVGMVFQNPALVAGTVRDNLTLFKSWIKDWDLSELELKEILEKVELDPRIIDQSAESLSGGEKQRLALARTLLNKPEVLLLDEPTSGLDPNLARKIINRVGRLHRELGLTIIMVTHHANLIKKLAQRILFLKDGKILEQGNRGILSSPVSQEFQFFLGEED